ncbi:penicillin-binding protein 1C [Escherichia coli]|uniref:Penicillin-binding protein 1C n=1 Tax=Escherichia coli TaxID=562 RepID=A0A2X1MCG6_ECOLX|nr:penicillin-binding protein 1C [Escherichia coli]
MLAVLPQAPSRLRPDRWPERAEAARNKVLERMAVQGVWSREQVKESREEPIWLAPRQMPQLAPLFSRMMLGKSKSDKSLLRWMPVFNDVWKNWRKTGKGGCHRAAHWR